VTASEQRVFGARYETIRAIGAGGMGRVYAAFDRVTGAQVALKTLLPKLAGEARALERFRREATVMGQLSHPHVVRVLDSGSEADGTAYLVMELLDGASLLELVRVEGAFEARRAARIGAEVAAALAAAHALGIVHRDVKPSNIVVSAAGAKVIDFGVAAIKEGGVYRRLTQTGHIVGTPSFMAPEQLQGGAPDGRTDVYALGATLWGILAGRPPYRGGPPGEVLVRVLRGDRPHLSVFRPDIGELAAIVERAMATAPADRFASAAELETALAGSAPPKGRPTIAPAPEEWAPQPTAFAPPDTALARPTPKPRRSIVPWLAMAIGAPAAIAVAAITVIVLGAFDQGESAARARPLDGRAADAGSASPGPIMIPRTGSDAARATDAGTLRSSGRLRDAAIRRPHDASVRHGRDGSAPQLVVSMVPMDFTGDATFLRTLFNRNRAAFARCWDAAHGGTIHTVLRVDVEHSGVRAELRSLSSTHPLPNHMHCLRLLFRHGDPWMRTHYRGGMQLTTRYQESAARSASMQAGLGPRAQRLGWGAPSDSLARGEGLATAPPENLSRAPSCFGAARSRDTLVSCCRSARPSPKASQSFSSAAGTARATTRSTCASATASIGSRD
jgi:serine/threonine-protein kinase